MPQFIVSLYSATNTQSALGIIDSDCNLLYFQNRNLTHSEEITSEIQGIALFNDNIYALTSNRILIYQINKNKKESLFQLIKEVRIPDWDTSQKNKITPCPILFSSRKKELIIANNILGSIDRFDKNGRFINRSYLWDISPELFPPPGIFNQREMNHGKIFNLNESANGLIYATTAFRTGLTKGDIFDIFTGSILLKNAYFPWGGIFVGDFLYVARVDTGELIAYNINPRLSTVTHKCWRKKPTISIEKYKDSVQNIQGIAYTEGKVYCGVCNVSRSSKIQLPPRIVAFNAHSGKQEIEALLPDIIYFRHPKISFITLLHKKQEIKFKRNIPVHTDHSLLSAEFTSAKNKNNLKIQSDDSASSVKEKPYICYPYLFFLNYIQTGNNNEIEQDRITPTLSIVLSNVSLCYRRTASFFLAANKKLRKNKEYWALRDLTLSIYEGDTVGLIGRNGSGKSTTAMMISGALKPDTGKVITHGKVQLLALGIGFRPQLTGRENALVSGTILGMPRKEIKERMDEIEEFAELGDFFDEPIRTYSAGMKSRLGFAVSTAVQPDILILDEVMSTGDAAFRNKANKRMEEMRERTKTVIIVSHSPAQVKELCSRVVWLEQGRLLMDGSTEEILTIYGNFCKNPDAWLADHSETADLLT